MWKIKGIFICIVDTLRLLTKALSGKSNKKIKKMIFKEKTSYH